MKKPMKRNDVVATTNGWAAPAGGNDNPDADKELLVAGKGLSVTKTVVEKVKEAIIDLGE